jgi:DUF4097 and DUF4098 domain-containing protein YvlB
MMILSATLIASLVAAQPGQDRSSARPPQTDQTVTVPRDARLVIDNFAGEVIIRGGDGDNMRVMARHATRAKVNIRTVPAGIRITSSSDRGPTGSVDYEITAPRWLPIKVGGQFNFVTVEGTQAEVSVDTVRGDVVVRGGNGVTVKSIEGDVTVEGAKGRVTASSVNEGVTVIGSSGEITAETVNGPISLQKIEAGSVEAGTINGDITYDGGASSAGRYRLTTHNGNITVGVPETANATFAVRTYNGSFNSNLPVKGDGNVRSGRRVTYTLGTGSAEFELESFSGSIRLRKPGTMPAQKSKED